MYVREAEVFEWMEGVKSIRSLGKPWMDIYLLGIT